MATGDKVTTHHREAHVAIANRMGPRKAMGEALAAFLLNLEFRVDGGDDEQDTVFSLERVFDRWPLPDERLPYPCASLVSRAPVPVLQHHPTPTPLEETWGTFDDLVAGCAPGGKATVLWKEGGASVAFQVDFWCDTDADREAVEALLPSAFAPEETAAGVIVEGPPLYYSRPVRLALDSMDYDDSAVSSYANERRLRCVVDADCDIVSLRWAQAMKPPTVLVDVEDPADPSGEED